jgi:tetratricopeptide (TPR) repeat protein
MWISRRIATCLIGIVGLASLADVADAMTGVDEVVAELAHGWAQANYQTPDNRKEETFAALAARAAQAEQANPDQARVMAWEAIILSSYAGVQGGFGAMDSAEKARDLLLAAAKIDDKALGGGIYTSLGALYYKVPGWPIGFGSDDKARKYLERGLALNPAGIDENFFYADFLLDQGEKDKARAYLQKALAAAPRPGREDADAGRRSEILADLAQANR